VVRVERGAVNDEVTLDIGGGKTLSATIHPCERGGAGSRRRRSAPPPSSKASHVILAVE